MASFIGSDQHFALLALAGAAGLSLLARWHSRRPHYRLVSHRKLRANAPGRVPAAKTFALPNAMAAGIQITKLGPPAPARADVADRGLRCEPALSGGVSRGESSEEPHPPTPGPLGCYPGVGPKPQAVTEPPNLESHIPGTAPLTGGGLGQPPVDAGMSCLPSLTGTQARRSDAVGGRLGGITDAAACPGTPVASVIELLLFIGE